METNHVVNQLKQVIDACYLLAYEARMKPAEAKKYATIEAGKVYPPYLTNNPFKVGDPLTIVKGYQANKQKQFNKSIADAPKKPVKKTPPEEPAKKMLSINISKIYEELATIGFVPANKYMELIMQAAGAASGSASAILSNLKKKYILEEVRVNGALFGWTVIKDPKKQRIFEIDQLLAALRDERKSLSE